MAIFTILIAIIILIDIIVTIVIVDIMVTILQLLPSTIMAWLFKITSYKISVKLLNGMTSYLRCCHEPVMPKQSALRIYTSFHSCRIFIDIDCDFCTMYKLYRVECRYNAAQYIVNSCEKNRHVIIALNPVLRTVYGDSKCDEVCETWAVTAWESVGKPCGMKIYWHQKAYNIVWTEWIEIPNICLCSALRRPYSWISYFLYVCDV